MREGETETEREREGGRRRFVADPAEDGREMRVKRRACKVERPEAAARLLPGRLS